MAQQGKLAFTDPAALEAIIEEYFASRWETRKMRTKGADGEWVEWEERYQRPPTMAGLSLAVGLTRKGLLNYYERDGFTPILSRARARIAEFAEEALYTREASNGARFALEVNHRYGREDDTEGGEGGGFVMKVIAPPTDGHMLAIAKWEPKDDADE